MLLCLVRRCGAWACLLPGVMSFIATAALANQIIPAGGAGIISNGSTNLACTDLTVGGVLDTGTGTYVNVRNVTVAASGIIQGTGTIRYSGTLSIAGSVQPGVKLILNLPTNIACPGPPPTEVAVVHPAPALDEFMLVSLGGLLIVLAFFALRGQAAQRGRKETGTKR